MNSVDVERLGEERSATLELHTNGECYVLAKLPDGTNVHPEGDLDTRIVAFYEALREVYPDSGPASRWEESPWADSPLGTGIDHVTVNLRHRYTGDAVATILELAALHDLVVFDPQDETVTRPPAISQNLRRE